MGVTVGVSTVGEIAVGGISVGGSAVGGSGVKVAVGTSKVTMMGGDVTVGVSVGGV